MKTPIQRFKASAQYHFLRQLVKDLTTYERPVYVLIIGQFLNKFGAFVFPFFALFLQSRAFSKAEIALVLAAISGGGLIAPLVAGYLSDSIGRRNTLVLSLVSSAVTLVAMYFCKTLESLMVMSAIHGFSAFLFGPPANALMTDLLPPEKRVTAFALFRLALNAGFAAGPTVAGLLFEKSPFLIFIGDASTTLAFAVLAYIWLPHGLRTIEGKASSLSVIYHSWKEAILDMAKFGPMIQFLVSTFLIAICFQQVFNVLSIASTDNGLSPAQFGIVMAFNGIVIVVVELPLCQWLQRIDYRRVIYCGYLLLALGTASFFLATTMTGYVFAMTLFTLGEIVSFPIAMAYMSKLTPEKYRGRYFGFKGMTWSLAGVAGSAGIYFYGQLGNTWWIFAGAIGLAACALMTLRFQDRRNTQVASEMQIETS